MLIDSPLILSLLSGADETDEAEEEEGCCGEDHRPPAPSSTPDQSQSTTQDHEVASDEMGQVEAELSNVVPLPMEEEPGEDEDSNDQSVESLMADWQEDLEAFKQMEEDEL